MSIIDKELLAKFEKINSREQSYNAANHNELKEFSDDDDGPISFSSTNEHTIQSTNSTSSLSYSSSNASSTSVPIRKTQSLSNKNLKTQFLNSINQQNEFNHLFRNNHHNEHLNNINSNNSFKSTNSLTNEHSLEKNEHRRSSALIEKINSLSVSENEEIQNENSINQQSNVRTTIDLTTNLNNSTIPSIDLNNLAALAKLSNNSESNLSTIETNLESNLSNQSDTNDKEDEENNYLIKKQFSNIKLNPFVQQDHKIKNLFKAAKEIRDSEKNYIDVLTLICVKYKESVQKTINVTVLDQLLQPFSTILQLNSVLLTRFNHCIQNWERNPKIANVLVELGPFLKHYADFATKFEQINVNYNEIKKKYPAFREATEQFEKQPICKSLTISHYFLKPIQRIGQYKLLIEKYIKYLKSDNRHPDYENALKALKVVSKAAEYTNEKMRESENFAKLLNIQQCIVGGYEIIKPHRRLIMKDVMFKISRKMKQERLFILCSDCLIYLTILKEGSYKVNHELPLNGMRVSSPEQDDFQNEILIRSSQRSIRVIASSINQKNEWIEAIQQTIYANVRRRSTLTNSNSEDLLKQLDRPVCLGEEAPIWTPDSRVSMCQICTLDFSITNRRHHCRACGIVVCSKCSKQSYYLVYLKRKQRVCDNCFTTLTKHAIPEHDENNQENLDNNSLKKHMKLSSSDPQLNNQQSKDDVLNDYKKVFEKVKIRRNSSNLTSISNRSSSLFYTPTEEQMNGKENDDLLMSMLEESTISDEYVIINNNNNNNNDHYKQRQNSIYNINGNSSSDSEKTITQSINGNHNSTINHNNYEIPSTPQPDQQQTPFSRNLNLRQSGRRRVPKVLTEISANDKDSDMSGYLFKRKGKKQWRKHWFVLKQHVLYSFKQSEDVIAMDSMPVLGYTVQISDISIDGYPANLVIQLTHQNQPDLFFKCTEQCVEKWFKALKAATNV